MSILKIFTPKQPEMNDEPTREELLSYHAYDADILVEGFISPLVLPKTRILELKGSSSFFEMAAKCKVSGYELETLCTHDYLEPTVPQLLSISWAYDVSVMWLLGYHTLRERHGCSDSALIAIIARRNAAEAAAKRLKRKGALSSFFISTANKRVQKLNLAVSSQAAHITAMERLPLDDSELILLTGQPVYVVPRGLMEGEWGLCEGTSIYTLSGRKDITLNGEQYLAFLTPDLTAEMD